MATSTSTSESAKKSFFKDYLRYNLSRSAKLIIIGIVLLLAAIIGFTAALATGAEAADSNLYSDNAVYAKMLSAFALEAFLILIFRSAVSAFRSCTRKNAADALLSLPLTHCQRFRGDFLTGCAPVACVVPIGLIAVIIGAIMPYDGAAWFAARYFVTVFFAAAFVYCIAVLSVVLSGKTGKSIVTGIMLLIDVMALIPLWGVFFSFCVIGIADIYNISSVYLYALPSPLLFLNYIDVFFGGYRPKSFSEVLENTFPVESPLVILLYIAEIAAVIALCYFLSKHRKAENTGYGFAIGKAFPTVNVLTAITAAGLGLVITRCYSKSGIVLAIAGAASFAAAAIIGEVAMRQWANFRKRSIAYLAAMAATGVVAFTADATYGFGRTFYVPSENKVEEIIINNASDNITLSFASEENISQLCDAHKKLITQNVGKIEKYTPNYIQYEELKITYVLKNGSEVRRNYSPDASMPDNKEFAEYYKTARLLKLLPTAADSFAEKYANEARVLNPSYAKVSVDGIKGDIILSDAQYKEFAEIFADDVKAHFNTDELPVGKIYIYASDKYSEYAADYTADEETTDYNTVYVAEQFEILESYADTIAYLHGCTEQINANAKLYEYMLNVKDPRCANFSGRIKITADDLDLAPVKELLTLIKSCNPYDYETAYSSEVLDGMRVTANYFNIYYIPTDNIPRATELTVEIIKQKIQKNS